MNTLKLRQFGKFLTGREYAQRAAQKILKQEKFPLVLDFQDVISLGSSFGDEVVYAVARKQNMHVRVKNVATAVDHCLKLVAEDFGFKIEYIDHDASH